MKNLLLIIFAILCNLALMAQGTDSLTLEECLRIAGERSPIVRRKLLSEEALAYRIKNLGTKWLPAIGFNAQASYFSETVNLSDVLKEMPDYPGLPLDQYKVWADINQQIYDGGVIKSKKRIENLTYESDIQQVEAELIAIKQQVNQTYFGLMITRKSAEVLNVSLTELRERKKVVRAGVENGTLLAENLLSMDAEELRLQQKIVELYLAQQQMVKVLSILMDSTLSADIKASEPVEPVNPDFGIDRPEYMLFDKQKERLNADQELVRATDMPKLYAFSQGAYGRPGYNFLSQKFHPYYSVGVGMKWNFLNYGDSHRQQKIIEIQKGMVDIKRKNFDDQLGIQLEAEKTNLAKYSELLNQDEEILKLRKAITATSFTKLANGIITSTDYFSELNNEILAKLQYENHKILKLEAEYNCLLLQGKL